MADTIRVLFVDDEPELLDISKLFLEKIEIFAIDTCISATEALLRLKSERYDAIVSDYQMPEMDGITFLKQLKASGNTTPFIIFTGRGREEVAIEALNSGADFYIQKGGDPKSQFAELSNKIRYAVSKKQSEEALKESEERHRSVVDDQREMIARFTPDGAITFVNKAYRLYFASLLDLQKVEGKNIRDILQVKNYAEVEKFLNTLSQKNPTREIERVIKGIDGDLHRQVWSVRALFGANGNPSEYQVVGRDITDIITHKNTERELQRNEQRSLAVILNADSWIWEVDTEGTYRYSTPAVEQILGYRPDELVGKVHFYDLFESSVKEELKQVALAAIGRHEPFRHFVNLNCHRNGTQVILNTSGTTVFDEDGTFSGYCGIDEDITERKRAEETLRESENKFASVFFGSPVALTLVSAIDGKFVDVNGAFETATGYSRDEVMGITSEDLGIFEDRDDRERLASTLRAQKTVHDMEIRCRTKNGEIRPCLFSSGLILIGGRPHILSSIRDITDRKRAEDALKMANKKLNILSSITRHDINNQLAVLVGYLRILEKKQPDPTLNVYSQKVASAAERISAMIRFTKEYEQVGIKAPTWQDCRTLVDTVAKDVPLGHVIVKNALTDNTEVFADPLIVKVFYNMMDNAVRYGGKITTIRFALKEHDGCYVIVCEDDGDGVLSEEKERIFDWGVGKNTGLGLALSREILDITGISICATGEPGEGARFEMTVPKGAWRVVDVDSKVNFTMNEDCGFAGPEY